LTYKLLEAFQGLFKGNEYRHRDSTQGDYVASFLIDDLLSIQRSPKLAAAVSAQRSVLNKSNRTVGRKHRRGDGTFGAIVPNTKPLLIPETYVVALGEVASIEVGAEVKIMAKAMIKQVDRVGTDMINQAAEFRRSNHKAICVGIVGVNYAPIYRGLELAREYVTTGKGGYRHPIQEAAQAEQRIVTRIASSFDELIVFRFVATNMPPLKFAWAKKVQTLNEYGAALVRIASLYENRF
jgi:hypothetical protein